MSVLMLLRLVLLFMVMLLMFGQAWTDLDDGVEEGAEDDGDVISSKITINISKILKNLTKQSYSATRSSNSLQQHTQTLAHAQTSTGT